jgi:proprotein convertase subtilisin/kexin type 5
MESLKNTCISICPLGTFSNKVSKTCDNCDAVCASCYGPLSTQCFECIPPRFIFISINGDSICFDGCPDFTFLNKNKCVSCHYSCKTCIGPQKTHCTSCSVSRYLLTNIDASS